MLDLKKRESLSKLEFATEQAIKDKVKGVKDMIASEDAADTARMVECALYMIKKKSPNPDFEPFMAELGVAMFIKWSMEDKIARLIAEGN